MSNSTQSLYNKLKIGQTVEETTAVNVLQRWDIEKATKCVRDLRDQKSINGGLLKLGQQSAFIFYIKKK